MDVACLAVRRPHTLRAHICPYPIDHGLAGDYGASAIFGQVDPESLKIGLDLGAYNRI